MIAPPDGTMQTEMSMAIFNMICYLSLERAVELFEQDLTVYLLYEDNTEAMAFDREDINSQSGLFCIEKADWLALQDHEDMKDMHNLDRNERTAIFRTQ